MDNLTHAFARDASSHRNRKSVRKVASRVRRGLATPLLAAALTVTAIGVGNPQVHAGTQITLATRNPLFVEIDMTPVSEWLNPNAEPRE